MELLSLLIGSVAVFTASFFATVSGFGYALIATPLMSSVLPLKSVIIFVLFLTMMMRVFTMYTTFKDVEWKTVTVVSLGCLIGIQPGSWVLKILSVPSLGLFLSCALLTAVFLMSRKYKIQVENKTAGRFGIGIVSGFFGASTSVSGPPIVLYFLNEDMPKVKMRANMTWIFGLTLVSTAATYLFTNAYAVVETWTPFYYLVPANMLGVFLGERCAKFLSQELFRKLALVIVCLGAVMMLVSSLKRLGLLG
ncbi:MAG: sulfite exporter TauE/SafE family protein [Phascolarctobacterium sp.]|nr:sulfite exporter TauE/SafE family protein [Phascolarctobacterium sp.]